jgi:hypothetical protein
MSAKTSRSLAGTLLSRSRTVSSNRRRWHVVAPLLIALATPTFALSARADHVRPVPAGELAAVVAAYAAALNAGDVEGVLALHADDAVHVALPAGEGAGVYLGKEQVRLFYEQGVANGDRLEVVDGTLEIAGGRATFAARVASEPFRELGLETLDANAEVVFKDVRIATNVLVLTPASVRALLTARGTIPSPTAAAEARGAEPHQHEQY